jgi:hypothetical protein
MTTFDAARRSITKYATGKGLRRMLWAVTAAPPSEVRRRTHVICGRSNRSSTVNMCCQHHAWEDECNEAPPCFS